MSSWCHKTTWGVGGLAALLLAASTLPSAQPEMPVAATAEPSKITVINLFMVLSCFTYCALDQTSRAERSESR